MRKYEGEPDYAAGEYDAIGQRRLAFRTAVTWIIIVTSVIYLLEVIVSRATFQAVFVPLGLSPNDVFARGRVWQLLTYAFLHDETNLLHPIFNMLFLYWFGREIEIVWGAKRFLAFYLTAAVFAGLAFAGVHYLFHFREDAWCVGASGAVFAVVMVYALWWPNRTILFMFLFPMRVWTFVLITVAIEIVMLLQMRNQVANLAHLGGLLYGYLIVRVAPRLARHAERLSAVREAAQPSDDHRLDEVLEKVHQKGLNSLTWRERRFLKKMSRRR